MNAKLGQLFTAIAFVLLSACIVVSVLVVTRILVVPFQVMIIMNVVAGFGIAALGLSRWVSKPGKSARELWIVTISALLFAVPILLLLMRW